MAHFMDKQNHQQTAPIDNVCYHMVGPSDPGSSMQDYEVKDINQYAEASWEGEAAKNPHIRVGLIHLTQQLLFLYNHVHGQICIHS